MSEPNCRVVKVGGSLLKLNRLQDRLLSWIDVQQPAKTVIIVGGGELANAIRDMDRSMDLGDYISHWICIDLMGLTTRLLSKLLPDAELVDSKEKVIGSESSVVFFDCRDWIKTVDLPTSWSVTSDSIAAVLAEELNAFELVLLKSTIGSKRINEEESVQIGLVDRHFPLAAKKIKSIRVVNLKAKNYPEIKI